MYVCMYVAMYLLTYSHNRLSMACEMSLLPFWQLWLSWNGQGSAIICVWDSKHVQLKPLLFNWLTNYIPCITNGDLRYSLEKHL